MAVGIFRPLLHRIAEDRLASRPFTWGGLTWWICPCGSVAIPMRPGQSTPDHPLCSTCWGPA